MYLRKHSSHLCGFSSSGKCVCKCNFKECGRETAFLQIGHLTEMEK